MNKISNIPIELEKEENKNFYSKRAIIIATFLGGPLAASYLIKKNYDTLEQPIKAKNSLIIGIASTIILFAGIFSIPEPIIDKIPNSLIPLLYSGIVYLIVERLQGKILHKHKESDGKFHSGWKAAGVGGISLLIIGSAILLTFTISGSIPFFQNNFDAETYDTEVEKFMNNETKALSAFDLIDTETHVILIDKFSKGLELWEENIEIVNKMNSIENLPNELIDQNTLLLEYCELRIKHYELIIKAISEDTDIYDKDMNEIGIKIENVLNNLNNI